MLDFLQLSKLPKKLFFVAVSHCQVQIQYQLSQYIRTNPQCHSEIHRKLPPLPPHNRARIRNTV